MFKINKKYEPKAIEVELWNRELRMIEIWDKKENKKEFSNLSRKCFYMLTKIPIPEEDMLKIKHILKLIAYAYLGEIKEDGKKFILKEKKVWEVYSNKQINWRERLLRDMYLAILHIVKGESYKDFLKSINLIYNLKKNQAKYEGKYLNSIPNEFKKNAALELASLYHFAKSIEILGEFMLEDETSSDRVISEIDYHLNKGIKFCDASGNFELYFIIQLVRLMFKKIILYRVNELKKKQRC